MKYTLNSYGWSGEFVGKTLTKKETEQIENLMEERGVDELWDVRFEIENIMDFDIWDGDLLHITKPFNNDTINFELLDENNKVILSFYIESIKHVGESKDYIVLPTEKTDLYLSIDENKGGIFSYEFESDVEPVVDDFTYQIGFVETPGDNYWDLIDEVLFKGSVLEITDFLGSDGKSSDVQIYKNKDM